MKRVLVVSPHRDDAAFSCAIAIRFLVPHCSVTVANFFTISRYAPFGQQTGADVTRLRLREDEAFAQLSGVVLHDLDLTDAPERLQIDVSAIATVQPFDARDREPLERVRQHVSDFDADLILLPLALGDHIDHRIAQSGTLSIRQPALAFYEDLPYAARIPGNAPAERAALLARNLTPKLIRSQNAEEWKSQCARCYPSQIESGTVDEIASFSRRYDGGERYWVTPAAANFLDKLSA